MIEPKTEKVKLFGEELILSERIAGDVNKLINYSKQKLDTEYQDVLIEATIALSDSLKHTLKYVSRFNFLKKWRIKKITTTEYLLSNLTPNLIFELTKKVYELEGIIPANDEKKKETKQEAEANQ